jgi:flagellum-specific ATP synthase
MNEPVADTVRSILDGHIVLTRTLAERNHYPAIDILASVSRVMPAIASVDHVRSAAELRASVAEFEAARDLIEVGAYAPGSNGAIDRAIQLRPRIEAFLRQGRDEHDDVATAVAGLGAIGLDAPAWPVGDEVAARHPVQPGSSVRHSEGASSAPGARADAAPIPALLNRGATR